MYLSMIGRFRRTLVIVRLGFFGAVLCAGVSGCGVLELESAHDAAPVAASYDEVQDASAGIFSACAAAQSPQSITSLRGPVRALRMLSTGDTLAGGAPGESGRALLVVDRTGAAYVGAADGDTVRKFIPDVGEFTAVAFAPRGGWVARANAEGVLISRCQDGRRFHLARVKARINSLDFSTDGARLLIGAIDGKVYQWNFLDEAAAASLHDRERAFSRYFGHNSAVSAVRFHPRGRVFFSADWQGNLNAWLAYDADQFKGEYDVNLTPRAGFVDQTTRVKAKGKIESRIEALEVSADGELVVLATDQGDLQIWSVRGFQRLQRSRMHDGLVYSLALDPSGEYGATAGRDGFVRLWKIQHTVGSGGEPSTATCEIVAAWPRSGVSQLFVRPSGSGVVIADSHGLDFLSVPR